jgi:hypothetical protein
MQKIIFSNCKIFGNQNTGFGSGSSILGRKTYTKLITSKLFSVMVSNQELMANKEGTICSQTKEESKGSRNVRYPPTEATDETVAKIYYSPAEPEMGLKVDSNEK